ncbi:hypothetical protein NKH77_14400 [Streptomyces sp. M19]
MPPAARAAAAGQVAAQPGGEREQVDGVGAGGRSTTRTSQPSRAAVDSARSRAIASTPGTAAISSPSSGCAPSMSSSPGRGPGVRSVRR